MNESKPDLTNAIFCVQINDIHAFNYLLSVTICEFVYSNQHTIKHLMIILSN